ncbi:MAG: oxygen-independent coproporphyrinogen III oxidase [Pseudomonadota bacterium]
MAQVEFDAALIERYAGSGPRYTSYPTAVQFTPDYTHERYIKDARATNASGKPLSLYVHIPFCKSLCYYCGCSKVVTRNAARVSAYLHDLHKEIALQGALFDRARPVTQLHFGGGTPTYLSALELQTLMDRLGDSFQLVQDGTQEFSIEVDPRTVDMAALERLRDHGFNRLSLGVQDFDIDVQKAINRLQSIDEVRSLTRHARNIGFRSVSYDLIYGLPKQSPQSFERTLTEVIALRPDRIAIYNYAHLPQRFRGQRMIRREDLPSNSQKLDILGRSLAMLTQAGYEYIGMDHFALPGDDLAVAQRNGTLQRNFQGYSTHADCDLVGLGSSAIGRVGRSFAQNLVNTRDYARALADDRLPIMRGLRMTDDDQRRAEVIGELMCFDEVRFDRFETRHAVPFTDYFGTEVASLAPMAGDALITIDADAIRVTRRGRMLLRNIAQVFDRYNRPDSRRFSQQI